MGVLRSFDTYSYGDVVSVPLMVDAENDKATDLSFWWNYATISKKVSHLIDKGLQVSLLFRKCRNINENEVVVDLGPRKRTDGATGLEWVICPMDLLAAKDHSLTRPGEYIVPTSWKILKGDVGLPLEFSLVTPEENDIITSILQDPALPTFVSEFSELLESHGVRSLFGLKISLESRPSDSKAAELNLETSETFNPATREIIIRHNLMATKGKYHDAAERSLGNWSNSSLNSKSDPENPKKTNKVKYIYYLSTGAIDFRNFPSTPKNIHIHAVTSSVVMDLSGAPFPQEEMRCNLVLSASTLKIIAPDNIAITSEAHGTVGTFKDSRDPRLYQNASHVMVLDGTSRFSTILVESPKVPLGFAIDRSITTQEKGAPPMILKAGEERKISVFMGPLDLIYRKAEIFPKRWVFESRMGSVTLDLSSGTLQPGDTALVLNASASTFTITVPDNVIVKLEGILSLSV
ncbi:hypothetical protein HDU97_007807 [Phlyctochytrium planicorne]|nr:hypothetical protein HDU97_007807 [Phlyctochytrium planicorne]